MKYTNKDRTYIRGILYVLDIIRCFEMVKWFDSTQPNLIRFRQLWKEDGCFARTYLDDSKTVGFYDSKTPLKIGFLGKRGAKTTLKVQQKHYNKLVCMLMWAVWLQHPMSLKDSRYMIASVEEYKWPEYHYFWTYQGQILIIQSFFRLSSIQYLQHIKTSSVGDRIFKTMRNYDWWPVWRRHQHQWHPGPLAPLLAVVPPHLKAHCYSSWEHHIVVFYCFWKDSLALEECSLPNNIPVCTTRNN